MNNATSSMATERLWQQLEFVWEIDRLKSVLRQTPLLDQSRRENSAEHSWEIALMAVVLAEYVESDVDIARVLKMALIHDLVEIDAGDTFIYGDVDEVLKSRTEREAARKIFGRLPDDQGSELEALWIEFEEEFTADAKFAAALDRLQPLLHNYQVGGGTWKSPGVTREKVINAKRSIEAGSPALWALAMTLIDDAVKRGYLEP